MTAAPANLVILDPSRCDGCGVCAAVCPALVFAASVKHEPVRLAHPERCLGCLSCEEDCPRHALTVHRLPSGLGHDQIPAPGAGLDADRVFDLVVVGAGPAGLGAAIAACQLGLCVAVLERLPSPLRAHHPDGGLLFPAPDLLRLAEGPRGLDLPELGVSLPNATIRERLSGFVYMGPGGLATRRRTGKGGFASIDKDAFVAHLAARATDLGARIAWNTRVERVETGSLGVAAIPVAGPPIRGRVLICAEGSTGRFAVQAGIPVDAGRGVWSYGVKVRCPPVETPADEAGFVTGPPPGWDASAAFLGYWSSGPDGTDLLAGTLQASRKRAYPHPLGELLASLADADPRIPARLGKPPELSPEARAGRGLDGCRVYARRLPTRAVADRALAVGDTVAACGMMTNLAALTSGVLAARTAAGALARGDLSAAALAPYERAVFRLSAVQGMAWMHRLLIEAPMDLPADRLAALFGLLGHLDLSALQSGPPLRAAWAMLAFYARIAPGLLRHPDLRGFLLPR